LAKVAWAIGILMLILDLVCRKTIFPMSLDFARFSDYAAQSDRLQLHSGLRVAFVGNSATEEGIDVSLLKDTIKSNGVPAPQVELFLADDSRISTWRPMMQHYFWSRGNAPDLIVVTFFGNALSDGHQLDIGRLAQFFSEPADWPDLFSTELTTLDERVSYVLSYVSALYAARERIKDQVLSQFVPNYAELLDNISRQRRHEKAKTPQVLTYTSLEKTLSAAQAHGSRLCFVAYPMPGKAFEVSTTVRNLLKQYGAEFIDMQQYVKLNADQYKDSIHLNSKGRPVYTRRFAEVLIPLLAKMNGTKNNRLLGASTSSSQ
jgi:hypothetical protein